MGEDYLSNDEEQEMLEELHQKGRDAIEAGADLEDVVWKTNHIQAYAYNQHIARMCEYLTERVLENGGSVGEDEFEEILHEQVDSDRWVFMTGLAEVVGTVSDNAAEMHFGGDAASKPGRVAICAIKEDIRDRLRARQNTIERSGPMGDQEHEMIEENGRWLVIDKDGEEVSPTDE